MQVSHSSSNSNKKGCFCDSSSNPFILFKEFCTNRSKFITTGLYIVHQNDIFRYFYHNRRMFAVQLAEILQRIHDR